MQTHYVNADFDLSLRSRRRQVPAPSLQRQIEELSLQGLLGAAEGDRALLRCGVPEEFTSHLASCGLTVPAFIEHPAVDLTSELRPFGWNEEAIALNRRHAIPVRHPELAVIRRINARSFGVELEQELGINAAGARAVSGTDELAAMLGEAPGESRWVVKAEHGNAGLGNLRLAGTRISESERRFVARCLAADERFVLERWLPRRRDWCTVFDVPFRADTLRTHESICTDGGALVGALFEPGGPPGTPPTDKLRAVAERIASRLDREGYFGPVCLDSFAWLDDGVERLRPLVDLNCRRAMTDRAHALWTRHASDRTLYYRFFNRRKLELPARLTELVDALGSRRYDPARRQGILLASPLQVTKDGRPRVPVKLAVGFVADDRGEAFGLERWFRRSFER